MQNLMIILFIPLIFFVSLNGMIQPQDDKTFLTPSMQIMYSLINTKDLDHTTLCSLALNKQTEKWLRETAVSRKECLHKHISHQILFEDTSVTWHKYGSACAKKVIHDFAEPVQMLLMVYYMQKDISYKIY